MMSKPRQITADEAKRLLPKTWGKRGLYRGNAGKKKRDDGYDSQLEADYAQHLATLKLAGEIDDFMYHPFRARIAGGAYYTPDFMVIFKGSPSWYALELHEVKGFWREAAAVRVKVAADKFPWFRFKIVSRAKKTDPWKFEDVGR